MKKKSIFTVLFLFAHIYFIHAQQILTDNTQEPEDIILNLVGDGCATASNVSSSVNGLVNDIISYGTFERGDSNFPLQNGIILSTGSVSSAGNNFIGEDLSEGEVDWTTDTDILDVLGINQTLNATSIEFDFTSANNFIAFKYLFASDEYQQEYPCNFEDVFAVLIKRAGTADPYVNIALTPTTNMEVSTNTIHPNINGFCEAVNEDYFEGYNLGRTNFNGSTTVLTATSDIIPNETYHIKFVIADHIDERFDSAVFIEAESFGSSVDLGPDQSICGNDLTLDANINNPNAMYSWLLEGELMPGENNPTLEVTESGTYEVEIFIPTPNGNCNFGDSIEIEIIPFQEAEAIEDLAVCDPLPNDGIYDFDFSIKNDEIYANLPSTNYTISYHLSVEEAQNNLDPIIGIYQNTELSETIFVRIESLDGSCLQVGSFNIIINSSPNIGEFSPLKICNGYFLDGIMFENPEQFYFPIANFEFNRTVSFHLTEEDALNYNNQINSSFEIPYDSDFLYARVEDNFSNCVSIKAISLLFFEGLDVADKDYTISLCGFQEYQVFNLGAIRPQVIEDFGEVNITFHTNYADALVQNNILLYEVMTNQNPFEGTGYMHIKPAGSECGTVAKIDLFVNLPRSLLGDTRTVNRCDDSSNDGVLEFDLNEVTDELSQGYDMEITYYLTEEDQFFSSNPLDQNIPFQVSNNSQVLYVTSNYEECYNFSEVVLNINNAISADSQTVDTCGDFNSDTGATTVFLSSFRDLMNGDNIGTRVDFFENETDAINNENILVDTFDILGDSKEFFVRVSHLVTKCYDIVTLTVNVSDNITYNEPSPMIVCNDEQNGISTVNLESVIPEILNDTTNLELSFFESFNNAVDNELMIENPQNYETQSTEIFLRIQRSESLCFTITSFEVLIYDNPQPILESNVINCELNPNLPSDFFLMNHDSEILNGQTGMNVLYFETQNNALERTNPIDKTIAYQNTSNPQTLYVRVDNEEEQSCFSIGTLIIEVRQAPNFNYPTNIPVCGTNGDGPYTVDLNEKIAEISEGSSDQLSISFHTTPLNANLGTNTLPLSYTTAGNGSETIYTRVLNTSSGCYDVISFDINILNLPEINQEEALTKCGNNFQTNFQWDLTVLELDILDGRQYGIVFDYYTSEEDAENNENPILNPSDYTNTNELETIYARVGNTVTGCFSIAPFSLVVNSPPDINPIETYNICDNAEGTVNLSEIDEILLDNTFNVLVSYYSSEADAEAQINTLNTNYNYTNTVETLFVRVEYSTTNCYAVHPFQLVVNPRPTANQPNDLMACDDDFDGITSFNLSAQDALVLNGQNPADFAISYFNSEINAIQNNLALSTEYVGFDSELIYARVENISTGCYDITEFSLIVNPLPNVDIEDQVLCLDNLPLQVSADTYNPTDTYLWSTNETTEAIEITEFGTYSVTVTSEFGCEITNTFNVTESESAVIDVVETIDFSDPNNITVTVNGIGNYLYQLNEGTIQASNVFENVPIGINTITIIDQNGCAEVTRQVLVIDTPKHLTPNNDGQFDTWHIVGVENLPGTTIQIFDRFGKLLIKLDANSPGWDGTYNGNNMPAGDYWFVADVIQNGDAFTISGHFALKR